MAKREQAWVALLRGINLGKHKRVPMAELRDAYEQAGCRDVRTYIASGNVVFSSDTGRSGRDALAGTLGAAVEESCGVSARVALRTAAEIAAVVDERPFGDDTSGTYVVFLLDRPPRDAKKRLAALDTGPDEVEIVGSEVYVRYPNGLANAQVSGALLDRTLGVEGTNRNWRTVTRLAEMAHG